MVIREPRFSYSKAGKLVRDWSRIPWAAVGRLDRTGRSRHPRPYRRIMSLGRVTI